MKPLHLIVSLRRKAESTWHALLLSSPLPTFFLSLSLPLLTGFTGCTPSLCSSNAESTSSVTTGTWQSHDDTNTSDARVLRRVFEMLDADGDGYVSADDVARHLAKLGLGEENIEVLEEVMARGRARGGDLLDYEGFVDLYEGLCEGEEEGEGEEEVAEAFAMFDKDGDGFISVQELRHVLLSLGFTQCHDEAFCHLIIKSVGPHLDGKIDLPHFRHMML